MHQLAVHHHEGLGDGPLEARRLVSLVVAEGEEELAEPGVSLLVALRAISRPMSTRRGEQGIEELLRRHGAELHRVEQPLFLVRALRLDAAGLIGPRRHDPANQLLDVVSAGLELLRQLVQQLGLRGGIVGAQVINGVDEAPAQEVGPHPVGHGTDR